MNATEVAKNKKKSRPEIRAAFWNLGSLLFLTFDLCVVHLFKFRKEIMQLFFKF